MGTFHDEPDESRQDDGILSVEEAERAWRQFQVTLDALERRGVDHIDALSDAEREQLHHEVRRRSTPT